MLARSLLVSLLTVSVANAHFTLRHPTPFGASAQKQDSGPCGGYSLGDNTPVTEFHVDGEPIAYSSSHPEVKVLFHIIEGNDPNAQSDIQAYPILEQYGAGDFCQPKATAPKSLVGKQGILQVVQNAVDGMLYACAYVKFVNGALTNLPDSCKNGTGVDAALSDDAGLQAILGNTGGDTPDPTNTNTSPSPTGSPSSGSLKSFSLVAGAVGFAVAAFAGL